MSNTPLAFRQIVRQIGIRQRSLAKHCRLGRATELVFILATGTTLVLGGGALAETWDGQTDDDFLTDTNWDGDTAPTAGSAVVIDGEGGANQPELMNGDSITVDSVAVSAGTLTISGDLSANLGVTISDTGTVTVSASASISGNVGVQTGGTLTLAGNNSDIVGDVENAGTLTLNDRSQVDGNVTSSGTGTNDGTITGTLEVTGGTFENSGDVGGATTVSGGTLTLATGTDLANTEAVNVSDTGTLTVNANDTVGATTLSGGTIDGPRTLTVTTFNQTGGDLAGTVSASGVKTLEGGDISGTLQGGGATTIQTGTTTVTGTITGNVTVASGTLVIGNSDAIGGSITTTGSIIAYADSVNEASALIVDSNTTQLSVAGTDAATQSGVISELTGPHPIEKIGTGTLTLSGANTYTGLTTVSQGTLIATNDTALGTTAAGTTVSNGATLAVSGEVTVTGEALTLNGTGAGGNGALNSISGSNTWTGTVDLATASTVQVAAGTLTLSGTVGGAGTLTKTGTGTLTLTGANTYTGETSVTAGRLNITGTGSVAGASISVSGGTLATDGDALAAGTTVTVSGSSTFTTSETDSYTAITQTGGTINGSGVQTLSGAFTQSGGVTGGTVDINAATFTQSDGATIGSGTNVTSTGTQSLNGGTIAGTLDGVGAFSVGVGTTTVSGSINFAASGTVASVATLTSTGNVMTTGGLTNDGTVNMAGTLGGAVVNNNTFNVTGALLGGGGGFTNTASGDILNVINGNFTNVGNILNGGTINVTGRTLGGTVTSNSGSIVLSGGTIDGAVTSTATGTIRADGANNVITGSVVNGGEILMNDTDTTDVLAVNGDLSGGTFRFNTDLSGGTADRINVTGNVTGTMTFEATDLDNVFRLGDRVTVLSANNAATAFGANQFVLGSSGGAVVTRLENTGTDLQIVAQTSAGIGGVAAQAGVIQSIVMPAVNRPTAPFTGGLATEQGCFRGGYARAAAGRATVNSVINNGTRDSQITAAANWSGVQAGFDIGCNDGRFFDGWDGAIGALIGQNQGSTSQDVLVPGGDGSDIVSSQTKTDFSQQFIGLYVAGNRDRLQADLQLRFDSTDYDLSETALGGDIIGLDGESFSAKSTNATARASYWIPFGKDKLTSFVPTVGLSMTQTGSSSIEVVGTDPSDFGTLDLNDHNSVVGILGATVARTVINEKANAGHSYFISGNVYQDFGGDRTAVYTPSVGATETITIGKNGTIGEIGVGWSFLKSFGGESSAASQLTSTIRIDSRFGENVSNSFNLMAQVRLTF